MHLSQCSSKERTKPLGESILSFGSMGVLVVGGSHPLTPTNNTKRLYGRTRRAFLCHFSGKEKTPWVMALAAYQAERLDLIRSPRRALAHYEEDGELGSALSSASVGVV